MLKLQGHLHWTLEKLSNVYSRTGYPGGHRISCFENAWEQSSVQIAFLTKASGIPTLVWHPFCHIIYDCTWALTCNPAALEEYEILQS